jgi:membrane protein DedA with SNARE-associated domain
VPRRRRFAPLWVYLFGLFAAALVQVWLLPPREHSAAFNVAVFAGLAALVIVVVTRLEQRRE